MTKFMVTLWKIIWNSLSRDVAKSHSICSLSNYVLVMTYSCYHTKLSSIPVKSNALWSFSRLLGLISDSSHLELGCFLSNDSFLDISLSSIQWFTMCFTGKHLFNYMIACLLRWRVLMFIHSSSKISPICYHFCSPPIWKESVAWIKLLMSRRKCVFATKCLTPFSLAFGNLEQLEAQSDASHSPLHVLFGQKSNNKKKKKKKRDLHLKIKISFLSVIIPGPVLSFNEATERFCTLIKREVFKTWQQRAFSGSETLKPHLDEK